MLLLANGKQQFIDQNGMPLAAGLVYIYLPNTTTPAPTYQDQAGQTANANPIQLDGFGQATIWAAGTFRQVVKKSDGTQVWDQLVATPDLNAPLVTLSAAAGAGLVGFTRSETGAATRTVQDRLRDTISVKDFGAKGDGVTDDTAAIQRAINAIPNSGGTVFFPTGTYIVTATLSLPFSVYNLCLRGNGYSSVLKESGATSFDLIQGSGSGFNYPTIEDLQLHGNSLSGTGNLIATNGIGTMNVRRVLLSGIPVGGSGIYINGINGTYNHDTRLSDIYIDTTTGFAGIHWGGLSADGSMTNVEVQGRAGVQHPVYFNTGASHIRTSNLHAYGGTVSGAVGINGNGDELWFTDTFFDSGSGCPTLNMINAIRCHFSNCTIGYGDANQANLSLSNSTYNTFSNITFKGGTCAYAVKESGTSEHNSIVGYSINGAYSAAQPFLLVGLYSRASMSGGAVEVTGQGAIAAGQTIYLGAAASANEVAARVSLPGAGSTRRLVLTCSNQPGAGQSFTATVFINGAATALTAAISGASGYNASAIQRIDLAENDFNTVDIRVVASAGAANATVFANLIVDR